MKIDNLCILGSGCFGCCGHDYDGKGLVGKTIKKNSGEFKKSSSVRGFVKRNNIYVRRCGICPNVIFFDNGKVGCSIHPEVNGGREFRKGDCEKNYLCDTYKAFLKWDKKKQIRFINFLKKKKFDWYAYSIKMDNGSLLKEFLNG